jgi:hypothetical protein
MFWSEESMLKISLQVLLLAGVYVSPVQANKLVRGVGFTCISPTGENRFLNIDLKKKRFQESNGQPQKIDAITETTITLSSSDPALLYSPIGPVITKQEIDRTTLILSSIVLAPQNGVNRKTTYQCQMGPPIIFGEQRKF